MLPLIPAMLAGLVVYILCRKETKNVDSENGGDSGNRDCGGEPATNAPKSGRRSCRVTEPKKQPIKDDTNGISPDGQTVSTNECDRISDDICDQSIGKSEGDFEA